LTIDNKFMSHDNPFQFPQDILMDYLTFYKENDYFKLVSNFPYSQSLYYLNTLDIHVQNFRFVC
jgi:hypothetical protein